MTPKNRVLLLGLALFIGAGLFFFTTPNETQVKTTTIVRTENEEGETLSLRKASDMTPSKNPDLSAELGSVSSSFPTLTEAKEWTEEELHGTPSTIREAGAKIGKLLELGEQDPARQQETLKFFMSCAENGEIVPSIRALCWKSAVTQIPKWNIFIPLSEYDVPQEIQLLGQKLF